MTDLRNLTILGLMGRLNMLIDEGKVALSPQEVKQRTTDGSILRRLGDLYGDFPEFSPVHKAEEVLLLKELKAALDLYDGREESKMGVQNNGLCLLVGYCIEMLVQRNIREVAGLSGRQWSWPQLRLISLRFVRYISRGWISLQPDGMR